MLSQKEINRVKDRAVTSAKATKCTDILAYFGKSTKRRGNQVYAVCYNCGTEGHIKSDKFSINTDENLYHCFGCGVGGGSPKLFSELKGISYMEACLYLAKQNGDITEEEYEEITTTYTGLKKLNSDTKVFSKIEEKTADEVEIKAPVVLVDLVYRHLLTFCKLTKIHKEYLLNNRGLTEEEIQEIGFFSYVEKFSIDELYSRIKKEFPKFSYEMFRGIPGFFYEYKDKEKKSGYWRFKAPYEDCVGIPLKNADGKISALQLRYLGDKETKNKYFYISSKNISLKGKIVGFGAGCGSPVATIYPDKVTNGTFCIGEGFFKMNELAKEGSVCFSIQGVNSYHYVADEVKACMKSKILARKLKDYDKGPVKVRFLVVFDNDQFQKVQVLDAGIKLGNFLKKELGSDREVSFLVWDGKLGKGFDDMKATCLKDGVDYHNFIKAIPFADYKKMVEESLRICDSIYKKTYSEEFSKDNKKFRSTKEYGELLNHILYEERVCKY